jgi:hypothetical protein
MNKLVSLLMFLSLPAYPDDEGEAGDLEVRSGV